MIQKVSFTLPLCLCNILFWSNGSGGGLSGASVGASLDPPPSWLESLVSPLYGLDDYYQINTPRTKQIKARGMNAVRFK